MAASEDESFGIELGEELDPGECSCCGESTQIVYGFVSVGGEARALYYAGWVPSHEQPNVSLAIGVGEDWEEELEPDRISFAVEVWPEEDEIVVRFLESNEDPFEVTDLLGTRVHGEAARQHPLRSEMLEILEEITHTDPGVAGALGISSGAVGP